MGERKGQNKYYPPDFDYKVHKSLSGYHGQHPLRERARKLDRGILVIRFEMPYNIWCDGCNAHIGMGVRYNSEKSKIGMYYTTPIYQFDMKCHLCPNHIVIKTDPANHDYVITSGARRKEQRWDPHENEQIVPEDRATQKKLALDSMYKLEHGADDLARGKSNQNTISEIVQRQLSRKDDHLLNQLARKKLRDAKKSKSVLSASDDAIKSKLSLSIDLVPENNEDKRIAGLLQYSTVKYYDEKHQERRHEIETQSIFSTPSSDVSKSASLSATASDGSTIDKHSSSTPSTSKQLCFNRIISASSEEKRKSLGASFSNSINNSANAGNKPTSRDFGIKRRVKAESETCEPDVDPLIDVCEHASEKTVITSSDAGGATAQAGHSSKCALNSLMSSYDSSPSPSPERLFH